MNTIQDDVLALFRKEIHGYFDQHWKEIPLELDYDLFDAPGDDLHEALNKFEKKFNVVLSSVKWSYYFPWENTPLLTRWFKAKREDIERTCCRYPSENVPEALIQHPQRFHYADHIFTLSDFPAWIARHSRLKLSTTVSARKRRPLNGLSDTKSILQH